MNVALGAEVVLHVAGALHGARVDVALELAEDLAVALADDVGQHVEPAAVRHADGDLVEAVSAAASQISSSSGIVGLAALEAEPLLPDELGLQEGLERLGLVELAQDPQLLLAGRLGVRPLDALLDPAALLGVLDVHVLDADGAAVGVAQHAEDVAQLHDRRLPAKPPVANSRSRSHRVRPWLAMSRSGWRRCLYSSGSVSAIRWPRTR